MNRLLKTLMIIALMSSSASGATQQRATPSTNSTTSPLLPPVQTFQKGHYLRSLSGLYSVQSFRNKQINQPESDFNNLYNLGFEAQQELDILTQELALLSTTQPVSSGLKSRERAEAKIKNKLAGQTDQITDLARSSLVADDIESMMTAFDALCAQVDLVEVKNRFKTPGPSGYRDLKVLVRLPKSQMIAELQFHLDAFSEIKNGEEHLHYERIQKIERQAKAEQRPLNDIEQASIRQLRLQSQQLYQVAWDDYLTVNRRIA